MEKRIKIRLAGFLVHRVIANYCHRLCKELQFLKSGQYLGTPYLQWHDKNRNNNKRQFCKDAPKKSTQTIAWKSAWKLFAITSISDTQQEEK